MTTIGSVVIGIVLILLFATIGYQGGPLRTTLGRLDRLKLLPSWSFFAPNPATRDSHVVMRDLLRDGRIGQWQAVSRFPSRTAIQTFWHPDKRPRKILRDACKSIKMTRRRCESKGVVQCSLPYLVVLHYCIQRARAADAVARQFAVVETSGRGERRIWITFISDFHPF